MAAERGLYYLAQGSDKCQELSEMLNNIWVPPNAGNFLVGRGSNNFSRTVLYGDSSPKYRLS